VSAILRVLALDARAACLLGPAPLPAKRALMAASHSDALVGLFGVTGESRPQDDFPGTLCDGEAWQPQSPIIVSPFRRSLARLRKRVTDSIKRSGGSITSTPSTIFCLSPVRQWGYKEPETFTAIKEALGSARRPAHYLAIHRRCSRRLIQRTRRGEPGGACAM